MLYKLLAVVCLCSCAVSSQIVRPDCPICPPCPGIQYPHVPPGDRCRGSGCADIIVPFQEPV